MVNVVHPEEDPEQELYSVRFESASGELGPPIGCWPEKLTDQP
jgi:nitrogen fixation protein NifZ